MVGSRGRSGGARSGQSGKAYPNRTDLNAQPVRTAPGQPYGAATAQAQAQQAVPMAGAPQVLSLHAPTQRPDEHVMTGSPMGPGAGPEALATPQRDFSAQPPTAPLTPRDRLQVMLQAGLDAGVNVDDLALLVDKLSR